MEAAAVETLTPTLQYGFAGFSLILVGVIVWLIRQLLRVLNQNNRVISNNTSAIVAVTKDTEETKAEVRALREELMKRSCLLTRAELRQLGGGGAAPAGA
jgi:cell division protein FtsB